MEHIKPTEEANDAESQDCESKVFHVYLFNYISRRHYKMTYINFQKVRTLFIRTLNVRTKKFGQFFRISDEFRTKFRTKLKNTKYFGQVHFYYV